MADDTSKEEFSLDLDASDFIANANSAAKAILGIADTAGNLGELTSSILEASAIVGVLGVAFLAVKSTMDLVFDAENIKAVNAEFDSLAKTSGVFSDNLKKGLLDSAQGWADEESILEAANKAMIQLQVGAEKLPELMTLARQATSVFGGSLVQNFQDMAQAVASGNTRLLKHLGIVVDQKKAYQDYAVSIGSTVDQLSQAGKQQAILDAVLEKGGQSFASVNTNIKEATNSWMQFKSTLKDIGDIATLAFDKIAGPTVKNALSWMSDWARGAKTAFTAQFGEGADAAAAKTEILKGKIKDLQLEIINTEQYQDSLKGKDQAGYELVGKSVDYLNQQLKGYQTQLGETTKQQSAMAAEAKKDQAPVTGGKADLVDHQKQLQDEAAFQQKMLSLKQQYIALDLQQTTSADKAEADYKQKLLLDGQQIDAQIAQVRAQAAQGDKITQQQAQQEILVLEEQKKQKLIANEQEIAKVRQTALNNYAAQSKTVFDGIVRGSQAESNSAMTDLKKFGDLGSTVSKGFASHMATAFQQMGSGAKSGSDAIQGALFGMIGDVAAKYGEMMMLASIFPFNPVMFAAGAALEVLAGALGSAAGGGSSTLSSSSSMTGSGVAGLPSTSGSSPALQTQAQKNAVNITIQGHMFQTTETQNWMVNTIRAAADATDFNIASVN